MFHNDEHHYALTSNLYWKLARVFVRPHTRARKMSGHIEGDDERREEIRKAIVQIHDSLDGSADLENITANELYEKLATRLQCTVGALKQWTTEIKKWWCLSGQMKATLRQQDVNENEGTIFEGLGKTLESEEESLDVWESDIKRWVILSFPWSSPFFILPKINTHPARPLLAHGCTQVHRLSEPKRYSLSKSASLTYLSVYDRRDSDCETTLSPSPPSSLTDVHRRCFGYHNPNWHSLTKSARLTYLSVYESST